MPKRVLSVGQCGPDHAAIHALLTLHFDCEVIPAHGLNDTLAHLKNGEFHLVLVNRKLDRDYSDGVEIIRALKADPDTAELAVMLVTNYPEHQEAAVAIGALRGFGKLELEHPTTHEKLAAVLREKESGSG
jgi:two-component system, chemotaxis family, chemotaxis protein CheY